MNLTDKQIWTPENLSKTDAFSKTVLYIYLSENALLLCASTHLFPSGGEVCCDHNMGDLCCMCTVETSKYRCPCCRLRYCSLDCSKRHKERCVPKGEQSSPSVPDVLQTRDPILVENDESDAVPFLKLGLLGKSEELKQLLLNIHLRQLLVTLDETENKDEVLKNYMQEPLFVELADMCLSLINPEEKENILPK
ncbi:hypothetical protein GDO81_006212 [Engystomops pustulosus]|uniref:HIT-type domain-containing protein n=2 Tax=Engystomops pustulosus TaxID=76066 RepID=A0AAV7CVM2_ENGPU|nr:hypothetical protein GDO81_006212 [Engystomops pustulosus]